MTDIVLFVFVLAAGLIIGSFLNVCIYRIPRGESVAFPASHCPSCDRPLRWFENVPVVSWLVLRGRCRTCRTVIPASYPLVEAVTGAVFAGAFLVYGPTPLLAVRLLFACALIVLFMIDLRHQILPNIITVPGTLVGFGLSFLLEPGWSSSLLGLLIGGIFPLLVAEGYLRLRGREGMGMGDVKMLAMVGAFLGWPLVWICLLLACVLGILVGGGGLLLTRRAMATRIPFGTFIAVAALAALFVGEPMTHSYESALDSYVEWVSR